MQVAETATESVGKNRRRTTERRAASWRTVLYGFLRSRRRVSRRNVDSDSLFLDWRHPWLFLMAVGTMLLSTIDAFLTLRLMDLGLIEANPLMAAALGHSTAVFAASKMVITGFCILTLVFLAEARFLNRVRTGLLLTGLFSLYACLVCYESVLLLREL